MIDSWMSCPYLNHYQFPVTKFGMCRVTSTSSHEGENVSMLSGKGKTESQLKTPMVVLWREGLTLVGQKSGSNEASWFLTEGRKIS